MVKGNAQQRKALVFALLFAGFGGLALWYWGAPNRDILNPRGDAADALADLRPPDPDVQTIVERYVRAVQSGDCATVIGLTWWMQERLRRNAAQAEPMPVEDLRAEMCATLERADREGYRLTVEGMEDAYLLTPAASYTVLGADDGAEDLAKNSIERVWLQMNYTTAGVVPRDVNDVPISTLRIGINISADGQVLKAAIRGNLEIDLPSLRY